MGRVISFVMEKFINLFWFVGGTLATMSGVGCSVESESRIFGQEPWKGAKCGQAEILGYGDCMVYQSAPDLVDDSSTFQLGNTSAMSKIKIKKSSEIKSNYVGINTTRMPRSRDKDFYYFSPAHLNDGDNSTSWMSAGHRQEGTSPAWIRADFPVEREISKVVIRKRVKDVKRPYWTKVPVKGAVEFGRAMASDILIESSTDGFNWTKIYDGEVADSLEKSVFEFKCSPRKAKMVRATARKVPLVECEGHAWSISEFEVHDTNGRNVAEISKGTAMIVSSSYNKNRFPYEFHSALWRIHNELGAKYIRIGYHDDPINWHDVERERGVYKVDPAADEAINGFIKDGMKIIMCLNFGNRLYTGQSGVVDGKVVDSKRDNPYQPEWYYDQPSPPSTEEALQAWEKYVEFMAKKYRDKVEYFEVWNEWNINLYWGAKTNLELYKKVAHRAIKVLKRVAPNVKIALGSVSNYPVGCEKWDEKQWEKPRGVAERERLTVGAMREFAPLVDSIGIHPYYQREPHEIAQFERDFKALKKWLKSRGFKGTLMISEWNFSSIYPAIPKHEAPAIWRGNVWFSEMQKAKFVSQRYMTDTGNGVPSSFCEMYNPFYGAFELSLLRRATDEGTLQPDASFYAVRNIATITDGFEPAKVEAKVSANFDISELRQYGFTTPDGKAVVLWLGVEANDTCKRQPVDVQLPQGVKTAIAIDVLNGNKQELKVENGKIKNLLLNDTPLVLKF